MVWGWLDTMNACFIPLLSYSYYSVSNYDRSMLTSCKMFVAYRGSTSTISLASISITVFLLHMPSTRMPHLLPDVALVMNLIKATP